MDTEPGEGDGAFHEGSITTTDSDAWTTANVHQQYSCLHSHTQRRHGRLKHREDMDV